MASLDPLRRLAMEQARSRVLAVGAAVSLAWLVLVGLFALFGPEGEGQGAAGWLTWLVGVILPLALVWLAVWSARSLLSLRLEAEELRAMLARMQGEGVTAETMAEPRPAASAPLPAARRSAVPPAPRVAADARQASLALDSPPTTELTPAELFHALNFPDGPEDREAIRCLRLALADPGMARLIRAAQDVVTLLAGQGVYMDELAVPEADPVLWRRFAEGARGEAVAELAVIRDEAALVSAGAMLHGDEVFRDVAHHFLRHFDRLMSRKVQDSDPQLLAALAETRSGRAFILLAQATGMLGRAGAEADGSQGAGG
ncbi:hypothetical protein ACDP63_22745 [Paracoccus sp. P2]|uniref:Uncharacterized protein n=1 Tax=Paracoccus pantotrophus TaxID=82367 RepID=A0A7H9BXM2_PARPN|nr:hypothetical protein [Paracoccus pantotrophus]MDF3854739.1 hypothetical protein [Paracoccus pantotrophus]QLH15799.1 hypothetical protein HYQ43_16775 [Paracoccus pantotrophus]RDD94648.1 hypothetical protein DTW92_17100 [Paracoccus pantotrophus]RNI19803.1 hypothetical protein EB844_03040 [Paracoccus pantotrophus]WGR64001.1 hypothetical protein E3U24_01165 [Paracoccus pantotrophus]